jgi:hypothetical protein
MRFTRNLKVVGAMAIALGINVAAAQRPNPQVGSEQATTGIPECDKYFAAVDACVSSKTLSKEDQQSVELNVNRLRLMLPMAKAPEGRATLVTRCTASLDLAVKENKYACYKVKEKAGERVR